MQRGLAIWIAFVLGLGCGNEPVKVTRADCAKVADHIADLIVAHHTAHAEELWQTVTAEGGETAALPPAITQATLGAFLATSEGRTWLLRWRGHVRSGTERGIEPCVASASMKQVGCLLAATTRDDVNACDATK